MSTQTLLADLRTRDIEIVLDGDRLAIEAAPELLTAELMDTVREHKPAIIQLLKGGQSKQFVTTFSAENTAVSSTKHVQWTPRSQLTEYVPALAFATANRLKRLGKVTDDEYSYLVRYAGVDPTENREPVVRPKPAATSLAAVEFLYSVSSILDESFPESSIKYRVVKKTATSVFVSRRPYSIEKNSSQYNVETYRLDREHLEREGWVRQKGRGFKKTFYTAEGIEQYFAEINQIIMPECFSVLELVAPCSVEDVKAAYRSKARVLHPDAGGDHEQFIVLQTAYESALEFVAARAIANSNRNNEYSVGDANQ